MTFIATCFFIILYFIRPFEIITSFRELPILFLTGVIAGMLLLFDVIRGKVKLFNNGTDQMMLGLYIAIALSHISHLYFGGALQAMRDFFPIIIGYFLIAHTIDSEKKLKVFIGVLIICAAFLAIEGVFEIHEGTSYFGVKPLEQVVGVNEDGSSATVARIKWVGPFSDPNDLAMVFVFVIPMLLDYLLNRKIVLPFALLCLMTYGLYLTNSRGGVLSLLAAISSYFILRYRSRKGLLLFIILAIVLINFGPSRMGVMSASEESAYGRLEAWYEGYQMFKGAPFLGVGKGMFTANYPFTAHNSFVLIFSELGLIGAFFFVGVFYFPLLSSVQTRFQKDTKEEIRPELLGSYNAILSGLIGTMVAMSFLSRSYVLLPYILVAVSMAILFINDRTNTNLRKKNYQHYKRILFITVAGIVVVNIIIKILL